MEKIKMGFMGIGTFLSYMVGGFDLALEILVTLIVIDYITGVFKGVINKTISSQRGYKGIAKKALIFIVLILSNLVDRLLNVDLFRTATIFFYIANEGISILENVVEMGVPIPKKIQEILIQIKNKESEGAIKND